MGGRWDGLVVLCATSNWDGIRLSDRPIAENLARYAPVLYVDPPLSRLTARRHRTLAPALEGARLRAVGDRIARLTPVVLPRRYDRGMIHVTNALVRHSLGRAVRRLGGSVHAVVTAWSMIDPYGVFGERRRVYWWRDDAAAGASFWGRDGDELLRREQRIVSRSDVVVAVNEAAAERWRRSGHSAVYVPAGCDAAGLAGTDAAPWPADVTLAPPIAGFVGHINERTDLALLEAVADRGISLLLVGPRSGRSAADRFARLVARPNVEWVGPRPFEQMRSYLRCMDVGLVPYGDTEFNRWSFPLKILEYLAAGRAVVSTPLPAVRSLASDLIATAAAPQAFAVTVAGAVATARDPVLVAERRRFARAHSWADRAARFAEVLELAPSGPLAAAQPTSRAFEDPAGTASTTTSSGCTSNSSSVRATSRS